MICAGVCSLDRAYLQGVIESNCSNRTSLRVRKDAVSGNGGAEGGRGGRGGGEGGGGEGEGAGAFPVIALLSSDFGKLCEKTPLRREGEGLEEVDWRGRVRA